MKNTILVFAALLALASCEKFDKSTSCTDPDLLDRRVLCTADYDPVCGCDGKTYSNACVAKFQHGIKQFTNGACACSYPYQGEVVDYTGLDGCGLVIELDSHRVLEPHTLPEGFSLRAGTRVEFDYLTSDVASICMVGEIVNVTCIREISCLAISEPAPGGMNTRGFNDAVSINKAEIKDDCLEISFSHGGGCEEHQYKLIRIPVFCGTPPVPPTTLEFLHEANGDLCEALLSKTISFDLSSLRDSSTKRVEFYLQDKERSYSEKFVYQY